MTDEYDSLHRRAEFGSGSAWKEYDRDFDRETHQTHNWSRAFDQPNTPTLVYEGLDDDPPYQIAMPFLEGSWVYFIHAPDVRRVKIGFTTRPYERLGVLQVGSPVSLRMVKLIKGDHALEARLHYRFRGKRLDGEWFEDSVLDDWLRDPL